LTNVPLVFNRLSRALLLRIASSTALQIIVGIAVLAVQRYIPFC